MAGDWIPIRTDLLDDPAVIVIADTTGLDEYAVTGRLVKLWSWASHQLTEGKAQNITVGWLNRHVGQPGFAEGMIAAGWLVPLPSGGFEIPNFERWFSASAKRRLLANRRTANWRLRGGDAAGVTKASTRGEERESIEEEPAIAGSATASAALAPVSPILLAFPTTIARSGKHRGVGTWHLTQHDVDEFAAAYPAVDVLAECRKALAWIKTNPTKKKTYQGMPSFLNRWLAKCQDQGGSARGAGVGVRPGSPNDTAAQSLFNILERQGE